MNVQIFMNYDSTHSLLNELADCDYILGFKKVTNKSSFSSYIFLKNSL